MPPTINNLASSNVPSASQQSQSTLRLQERRSDLVCRIKYGNNLPDIPFDLKFLQYPFDSRRFVQYNPTSLERNYKYDVLSEHDLGVTIDLINQDLYTPDPSAFLHPNDEKLLEEDLHTPHDSVRSRQHSRSVSWLRKSEYISTEQTRFQPQNLEQIEAKVGYNVKKSLREETLYLDREAQIKAIQKTFDDSKHEITRHYSKPNVTAVEVLPLYPDFANWKYPCAQVIFDSDPAPIGKNVPAQLEEMSQAMIRGVMDESGEQFVAYFLPTESTLEKRRNDFVEGVLYKDDEEYEYKIAREYNWNVKSKASKGYEENYFLVLRQDGAYYDELETRVRLNKRRVKAGQQPSNTKLVVKHRPLDANEHRLQRYRERNLEPAGEEEEEEMEFEEEEEEEQETATQTQSETAKNDAEKEKDNDAETDKNEDEESRQKARDRASRSRTRSGSHRSGSGSASSSSRSRSGSRSKSRSSSKSKRSNSSNSNRSRSRSSNSNRSRSNSSDSDRSRSRSRSKSASRSRSGTPKSKSGSPRRDSRSASPRSGQSASPGSRSRSGSRSGSASPSGSGSDSD